MLKAELDAACTRGYASVSACLGGSAALDRTVDHQSTIAHLTASLFQLLYFCASVTSIRHGGQWIAADWSTLSAQTWSPALRSHNHPFHPVVSFPQSFVHAFNVEYLYQ
jgi:hypothetical protein